MKVLLTGATGYIGRAVLRKLVDAGHEVVAPVRSDTAAQSARRAGAHAIIGDLTDAQWLADQLREADASIHTASPGDATSADFDNSISAAVVSAFSGTAKHHLHTSGVWIWGSGRDIAETDSLNPPTVVAWRPELEKRLLNSDVAVTLPAPAVVFGGGKGIPSLLRPQTGDTAVRLIGDGSQHWTLVHVDDLADLYLRLLTLDSPAGYVLGVSGLNPTVREIAEAQSPTATLEAETPADSEARIGALLAEALLLDQQASGEKARSLGWTPTRTELTDLASA